MYRNTVPGLEVLQNPCPPPLVRHGQPQQLQQPLSQGQFASSSFPSMSVAPTYVQHPSAFQQSSPYIQPTATHQTTSLYNQPQFASSPCSQQMPTSQRFPSHMQPATASQAQPPFANAASLTQHASNQPNPYSGRVYSLLSIPVHQSFTEQNQIPEHQTQPAQMFQVNDVTRMDTSFARTPIGGIEQQKIQHNVPGNSPVFSNIQNPLRMPTAVAHEQIQPHSANQQKPSSLTAQSIALTEMLENLTARSTMQQLGHPCSSFQQIGKNTSGVPSALPGQNNNIPLQGIRPVYSGVRSTLSAQGQGISSGVSTSRHPFSQPMLSVNFPGNSSSHGSVQGQSQGKDPGFHQIQLDSHSQSFVHHESRSASQDQTTKHFGNRPMLPGQNVGHSSHIPLFQGQMEHLIPSSTFNVDTTTRLDANVLKCSNDILQQIGISEETIAYLKHKSSLNNLSQSCETQEGVNFQNSTTAQSHTSTQAISQSNDQSLSQDVALIQSAFVIPQSSQNSESHGRWYAHPFSTQPAITEEQRASINSGINSVLTEIISVSPSGAEIETVDALLGIHTNDKQENDESDLSIVPLSQHLREAESMLDLNKRKVIDELVLDSQCNYEDIDIRTYLPSPEFHPDFKPPESFENKQKFLPCSDNDLEVETVEACDTNGLHMSVLQPAVEMSKVENPSSVKQSGEKRKLDSASDDKTMLYYSPPVKLARGNERKIGSGKGCVKNWKSKVGRSLVRQAGKSPVGRGSARGKLLTVNRFSDVRKKNTVTRRKQSARTSRGHGKGQIQISEQLDRHDCKTSATITKIDGQVIQKPDELKALMDTFNNDELERHAVPLSTLKLLFDQWSQNSAAKDNSESGSNETSMKDKSEGETVDCNYDISAEDKSKVETIDCNNDDSAKDKSGSETHDGDNEKSAGSECKDTSEANESTDVASSLGVDENDSASALQTNANPNNTETFQKNRRNLGNKKSPVDSIRELSVQSDPQIRMDKDTFASNAKVKIEKYKDKTNNTDFDNQALKQEDHISGVESKEASVKELNCNIKNVTAQSYSLTADHKMTWVRFHGKTVTRLISPDGTFFILEEILKRCFRIKEPNKSGRYKQIRFTKTEILKIPDIKMESVFFDFVVQNLKDRDIIRTVPDYFEIISEDNANRLFHYECGERYCKDGCIAPYLRLYKPKSISIGNKSVKSGGIIKASCGPNLDKNKNVFEIIQEETKSDTEKLKLRKKKSSVEIKKNEVVDLCSDESDGYDSDKTCPYVDGKPNSDFVIREIEKQIHEQYQNRNITGNNMVSDPDVTIDEDKVAEDSVAHRKVKNILGKICSDEENICKKTYDIFNNQLSTIACSDEGTLKKKEDFVEDGGCDSFEERSNQPCLCVPVSYADTPDSSNSSKDPVLSVSENEMNIPKNDTAMSDSRINARLDSDDAGIDPSENIGAKDHNAHACEEDDDVLIDGWTFPEPPKTYPEGGTQKLSEAHETLMEIIEQANNAQTNEELSVVLDKVFCITKPLKNWTYTLFDSYESVLLTEAERIKQLTDMSESDEVDTVAQDTGDMYS